MTIRKGTPVRQKMPTPVQGVVAGFKTDEDTGEQQVLVEWEEGDGSVSSRYFTLDAIEEAPPAQDGVAPE